MASNGSGGSLGVLVVALVVLVGVGGWNYHRNYQAEVAERGTSPFAGYDDASLEALRSAYQSEIDALDGRFEASRSRRSQVRRTTGVGEGVEQFERVQRTTKHVRKVTEEMASLEARVRDIEEEQRHRIRVGAGVAVHFERLTGFALPI